MHSLHRLTIAGGFVLAACGSPAGDAGIDDVAGVVSGDHLAGIELGPHPVGFHSLTLQDATRPLDGAPRLIDVLVWYPAVEVDRPRVSYRDYFGISAKGQDPNPPDSAREAVFFEALRGELQERGMSDRTFSALLAHETEAIQDAPPTGDLYPVLYGMPGNVRPSWSYVGRSQYLASHGYVVVDKPSSRWIDPNTGVDAEIAEARLILSAVSELGLGAGSTLGLMGSSRCGACALVWQATDAPAQAVLSWDGLEAFGRSVPDYFVANDLSPASIDVPYAFLGSDPGLADAYEWDRDMEFVQAMMDRPGRYLLTFADLRHTDLSSSNGLLDFRFPGTSQLGMGGLRLTSPVRHHYSMKFAVRFFDHYLKQDAAAATFLCAPPEAQGVSSGSIQVVSSLC